VAVLKKYDFKGNEVGEVSIEDELLKSDVNSQMVKDYLIALRTNARQWSANTKSRAEVNHSGKKPHPQKGTGRARQGYLGAPQYKGGGRVFGPRPKFDQHIRINKKERRSAINTLFTNRIQSGRLSVLQFPHLDEPKTKLVAQFLKNRSLTGKKTLFLAEMSEKDVSSFVRSLKNIPYVDFRFMQQVNGYDVALNTDIFVFDSALTQFIDLMRGV